MEKKLIFLDIDGTLTKPGENVPPLSAQEAVRKARENGHRVFLCTGRNRGMAAPLMEYGFDGLIGSSGGYIECGGQVIYDHPITEEQKERAMKVLGENGIFRTLECRDGSFTDDSFKAFLRDHAGEGGNSELLRWQVQVEKSLDIRPMEEYQGQPAYKMVFVSQTMEQLEEPKRVLEKDFRVCVQAPSPYGYINGELLSRGFDKGQAVERICAYLQVPVSRTVGFGDSMNDWEMMEVVGTGVCMGNGDERLKELAAMVCPPVGEDGLYRAFRELKLI